MERVCLRILSDVTGLSLPRLAGKRGHLLWKHVVALCPASAKRPAYMTGDAVERTFVMIKPDAVGRRLCGAVIGRYERKGLRLVGLKMQVIGRELAERHYAEHAGKPFYAGLVEFITSGPTIQMVWEGRDAVDTVRKMNGATDCQKADVGTIRGDYGLNTRNNIVHASDSVETAEREIKLYFDECELWDFPMPDGHWLA